MARESVLACLKHYASRKYFDSVPYFAAKNQKFHRTHAGCIALHWDEKTETGQALYKENSDSAISNETELKLLLNSATISQTNRITQSKKV